MITADKVMTVRYWDYNGQYEDMNIYATTHEIDGTVMFIEPFAIVTDKDGVYRQYYNRERVTSDVEILEMSEF